MALMALAGVRAITIPTAVSAPSAYPFNQLVAFGDEFSDNGNGSYAHGITGNPANVYGFGTWTDGPVAVSYLSNLLGVPLRDLAFGGCCSGASFGATLDNNYTTSPATYNGKSVPSVHDQIYSNYT
jgi:phospholipase/lecithinase/hemolysin